MNIKSIPFPLIVFTFYSKKEVEDECGSRGSGDPEGFTNE